MKDQDCARDPHKHVGLIAQDVQPLLPSLVHGSDMLSLDYDRIGVVAIGAIQEQQALITGQKQKTADLEDQVAANKLEIESLRHEVNTKDVQVKDLTARVEKLQALVSRLAKSQPSETFGDGRPIHARAD